VNNVEQIYADLVPAQIENQTLNLNVCWFCNTAKAEERWATEIFLNKLQNTHYHLTGSTYKFLVLNPKIPCCRVCHQTHKKAERWSRILMIPGGIVGFIAGIVLPFFIIFNLQISLGDDGNTILKIFILLGTILGVILGYLLGRKIAFFSSTETRPKTYAKRHPFIIPLLEQGWGFGKPR
jgi:hypothetical protein